MVQRKLRSGGGAKSIWMPKYGRDFYGDEKVLAMGVDLRGWALRGLYDFLLWKAWDEGSIPKDVGVLAAMCGLPRATFAKLWPAIEVCWTDHPTLPGRLVQQRQERVRAESGDLSHKMRELAEKRWAAEARARMDAGQHAETDANSHAPPHCENACGPAPPVAVPSTVHKPQATVDGWMDGGVRTRNQNGEGDRSRSPVPAGEVAANVLRAVQP